MRKGVHLSDSVSVLFDLLFSEIHEKNMKVASLRYLAKNINTLIDEYMYLRVSSIKHPDLYFCFQRRYF